MRATWRMLAGRRDLRLVLSAGIMMIVVGLPGALTLPG
jgi:hypothetical protein